MSIESDEEEQVELDLDWKSRAILQAIYENGGEANTSEIKELTGIDDNAKILYQHHNKFVPNGLIELEQPVSETGRPPPKEASFTQRGVKFAEQIMDDHPEGNGLEDRVGKLEADISRLTKQINRKEPRESEVDLAELDKKTDQLLYQLKIIADFLNEQYDGELSEYRERREHEKER